MEAHYIVMHLEAPMQSWGNKAWTAKNRPTSLTPTKSGVVGLIANALGLDFNPDITAIARPLMHTRVNRAGRKDTDFHVAGGGKRLYYSDSARHSQGKWKLADNQPFQELVVNKTGELQTKGKSHPLLTEDEYLSDASFTTLLHTEDPHLATTINHALAHPKRPLYLGRRAYIPSKPIAGGILTFPTSTPLLEVFNHIPLPSRCDPHVTILEETTTPSGDSEIIVDQPVSLLRHDKKMTPRFITRHTNK